MSKYNHTDHSLDVSASHLREQLIDQLLADDSIRTSMIERAFRVVPRHLFVHDVALDEVYGDFSLITKQIGATPLTSSTQPSLMASMLEVLALREGLTVLEIGTGTGYNAALLCELVRDPSLVYSIDIDPDNVEDARTNLAAAGYVGVTLECRDGVDGLAAHAPYDRIIATCSISEVPPSWIDQLRDGGILVAPIWINGAQITPSLEKHGQLLVGQSTVLGGFMKIRPHTYEDLLAGSTQVESDVLISSEHPDLFPESDVMALLEGQRTLTRLALEDLSPKMRSAFFIFLALRETTSVEVFLETEDDRFGFGDTGAGIIDCLQGSACLVSREWNIVSYGHEDARKRVEALAAVGISI